jgi:hypothetical protein
MSASIGLRNRTVVLLVGLALIVIAALTFVPQRILDNQIASLSEETSDMDSKKKVLELSKIDAEISKIRSDTIGSLFWLKLIALFVTVGGAVGGYLVGQNQATMQKIKFEDRKNVDAVYQSIVQELSSESPILRAAAAVKLGSILKEFPHEWNVSGTRKGQLVQLTKQVLAAALSIESEEKVLKTLTINIVQDKSTQSGIEDMPNRGYANMRELDLSSAKAADAYWANADFTNADFYKADLKRASFRKSVMAGAQFRESILVDTVFVDADCVGSNFKMADLRGADFTRANLTGVNFENAKLMGTQFKGAQIKDIPEASVDISEEGDGTAMLSIHDWLARFDTQ